MCVHAHVFSHTYAHIHLRSVCAHVRKNSTLPFLNLDICLELILSSRHESIYKNFKNRHIFKTPKLTTQDLSVNGHKISRLHGIYGFKVSTILVAPWEERKQIAHLSHSELSECLCFFRSYSFKIPYFFFQQICIMGNLY